MAPQELNRANSMVAELQSLMRAAGASRAVINEVKPAFYTDCL